MTREMKPGGRSLRILVTAGPTREYIDPVRYLSNDSSGRMGFALAAAAVERGHAVTLIHGPAEIAPPSGVRARAVVSAADMLAAARLAWRRCDVLLMAAAVADYTIARPSRTKRKKTAGPLTLRLSPTVDILADLSAGRRSGQVVVGFALEDRRARQRAERKLRNKGLDAIVLNAPAAIGAQRSRLEVLTADGAWESWPAADKSRSARRLIRLAERLFDLAHAER